MDAPQSHPDPPRVIVAGAADAARAAATLLRLTRRAEPAALLLTDDDAPPTLAPLEERASTPIEGGMESLAASIERLGVSAVLLVDDAALRQRDAIQAASSDARALPWPAPPLAAPAPDARAGGVRAGKAIDPISLVGRSARLMNEDLARRAIEGKRVLITGAGGSIGSELARLAARLGPSALVLVERSENALFEIDRELAGAGGATARVAALHDVVDARATLRRFIDWRPQVVFHAAAHKHVPMMEGHPAHSIDNNLFGAKSVADASVAVEAERFVLISTDKAVNPSSVMGATKLLAERYVRSRNEADAPDRFRVVRFGNVLASACSVLPIWERQIAEGGPVTVTDPRMTRYFMTIPEAASLVLQAAGLDAQDGAADVFVLDMGEPVSILDLARRFIAAHGLRPFEAGDPRGGDTSAEGEAMPIAIVGARPGEKIHEELVHDPRSLRPTRAAGLLAWSGGENDPLWTQRMTTAMARVRHASDHAETLRTLREWVPSLAPGADSPPIERVVHPSPSAHAA